ncbi:MAG: FAD-dependent oxidoreductase [Clostridia bacterium]|nr:FAD-dependent oxidoreductase [Clostridia bacterium]
MESNSSTWGSRFTTPPQSYWIASTPQPKNPQLKEDTRVDVAIIGGGMVGITTAYLLKKAGVKVAVIEADRILQGTTGHTTAKLTSQHDLIYYKIKKQHGEEKAKQYALANQSAINAVERLILEHKIDCDFHKCPAFVYTQQDNYIEKIQNEVEAALSLGIEASYIEEIPFPFKIKAAVRFDDQARFHPRKFLLPLAETIPGEGSYIFEETRAVDIEEGNPCFVFTNRNKKVSASHVILASHYPFYDRHGLYFARLYPERSYALGIKIKGKYPDGMYITAEDPGRSLRSQELSDGELIIVGGEHHKTGQGEEMPVHYENLRQFADEIFEVEEILYRWSTQDYTSADEIPYVGHLTSKTPNIFVATGFRKWGMTNSIASSILLSDMILKRENPWEAIYNPSRFTASASVKNIVVENANVAKELIKGKLKPVPDDVVIPSGEAKVIDIEGQRVGAYKDEKGKLHLVDTTCTHMGCELRWNGAEKSWDCPCHGSRFTYEGEIVEGPALKTLKTDMKEEGN